MSTPDDALKQAEAALADGERHRALQLAGLALTIDADLRAGYDVAARALEGVAQDREAGLLFRMCHDHFDDPRYFYELGFSFMQADAPHLAQPVLRRAFTLAPDEPNVRVEFAVSLAETGRHAEAVPLLAALDDATLARNPAVRFQLGWCALLAGDRDGAAAALAQLGADTPPDLRERLDLGVARAERLGIPSDDDLTGWHFVQYGAALLTSSSAPGMGGRYGALAESRDETADRLSAAIALLERSGRSIRAVLAADDRDSEIVGRAVAGYVDVPFARFVPHGEVRDDTLVCAANAEALGAIPYLRTRTPELVVYAHAITWNRSAPYVPDIAGLMSAATYAPWRRAMRGDVESARTVERGEDPREPTVIADEIARLIRERPAAPVPERLVPHADLSLWAGGPRVATRPPYRQESAVPAKRFL